MLFSSRVYHLQKTTSHQSLYCQSLLSSCVTCLLKLFIYLLQLLRCSNQATFPNPSQGKTGVNLRTMTGWVSNSYSKSKALRNLYRCAYIYIYTCDYKWIYTLVVPRCIKTISLSIYLLCFYIFLCFLPGFAQHLGYYMFTLLEAPCKLLPSKSSRSSGWTSQYPWPNDLHLATSLQI